MHPYLTDGGHNFTYNLFYYYIRNVYLGFIIYQIRFCMGTGSDVMKLNVGMTEDELKAGFSPGNDIFSKREMADRLTRLFKALAGGSVCLLEGRWGAGKTTFVKQWQSELRSKNVATIYFDAFASDFIETPFEALAGAFVAAAALEGRTDVPAYKDFLNKAAKVGRAVGGVVAKVGVKAATLGVIGSAEIEALGEVGDVVLEGVGDVSEEAVKRILQEHAEAQNNFDQLRQSLLAMPKLLMPNFGLEENAPLIVFIDELDRCRPDFSLGIIEVLKHFFRVDGIHFVLIANSEALECSVNHKYGTGINSREYLEKFYDFSINYEINYDKNLDGNIFPFVNRVFNEIVPAGIPHREDLLSRVRALSSDYRLSLRQIESFVKSVGLSYISVGPRQFCPPYLVAFFCLLKIIKVDLYIQAKRGDFLWSSIKKFIADNAREEHTLRYKQLIQYYVDPNINVTDEEWRGFGDGLFNYGLDRLDVVPYICNNVIDLFGPPASVD